MLAIKEASAITGSNLSAIWYSKTATGWSTKSWYSSSPWSGVKAIKTSLGLSDLDDPIWEMTLGPSPAIEESPTKELAETGVIEGDPLEPFLDASPDPESLVNTLVSVGYPAANTPIPIDEPCAYDIAGSIASYAEKMIESGDSSDTEFASNADLCALASVPRGDPPARPPRPSTAPPWSPPPPATTPTAPSWTPGGWPTSPNGTDEWRCRTIPTSGGGSNCVCSREQLWGRWEERSCWLIFTCVRWHTIIETETCTTAGSGIPCPTGGPPSPGSNCTHRYR